MGCSRSVELQVIEGLWFRLPNGSQEVCLDPHEEGLGHSLVNWDIL